MGDLSPGEGTDTWLSNPVCTAAVDSDAHIQEGDRRRSEKKSATTSSHPNEVRDNLISNGSELQPKRNRTEQNPKEQSAATGASDYVPAEIITDILLGLPFSSVVRFGYATPEWRRTARRYVEDAFHNPKLAEHNLCLIFLHKNELYFADYPHENARIAVKGIQKPFLHLNPSYRIDVSYDGMLLLSDSGNNALFIYNPFTRDYTELPGSINPHKTVVICGFGYCSFTEVYKVMRVIRYYDESNAAIVDVQIISTGRPIWRSLGAPPPGFWFHLLNPASHVLVNGRIHWDTFGPLLSFDLLDEQFREIPKPKVSWLKRKIQALVIGGCLAVASPSFQRDLYIWVMTEYGVEESWDLKWIIRKYIPQGLRDLKETPGSFRRPVPIKYIGEPVVVLNILESGKMLLMYQKTFLVLYDPSTETFTDLELEELPTWIQTVVHKGRLTPVSTILNV